MKNVYKSIALVCIGLATIACVEENFEPNNGYDTTPGNDIVFTATAQMDNVDTKTVYGGTADTDKDGNLDKIDINWAQGDRIQIASLEAAGEQNAEYAVGFDAKDNDYTGSHSATSLNKTGDAALQWSSSNHYDFYAMYPSPASLTTAEERNNAKLTVTDTEKKMTAWLPVTQYSENRSTPGTGSQIIKPNMNYAYMHAHSSYDRVDANGNENAEGISLQFEAAVTALQFDITANTIAQNNTTNSITIKSLTLTSDSGRDITGKFTYDFSTGTYANANTSTGYSQATLYFGEGYTLIEGQSLDVTFFLLPQDIPGGDLRLQIWFSIGSQPQTIVRTATIKNAIEARKKYRYNDMLMPEITTDVEGSNWGSALDDQIYLTQLSVPVAGNAFSSYYAGDDPGYNIEQVLDYTALWNLGVRGFEFKTAQGYTPANNTSGRNYTDRNTVKDEYFVTNGQEMTGGPTFDEAFTYLAKQLLNPAYKDEFLVIIATYQSYTGCGAYDPQEYVNDLEYYFRNKGDITYTGSDGVSVTKNLWGTEDEDGMIVKLSSNSIVRDLRGKIAVVVRSGDDEFIAYSNKTLTLPTDTKLMYVKNWGTAIDCWDRRFSGYNRQMVFGRGSASTYIENYLYAIASNNSTDTNATPTIGEENTIDFQDGYPATTDLSDNLFAFNEGAYYIQEFARVVPSNTKLQNGFYAQVSDSYGGIFGYGATYRYLWVRWPESYSQKTQMIDHTLSKSMSTIGQTTATPLFINSLAGYYVTDKHKQSYLPYAGTYSLGRVGLSCADAGMGGDIAGLAGDLNYYLYDKLIKAEQYHQQGPLGLIIMNYIGASAENFRTSDYTNTKASDWASNAELASAALPNMILMNNFKFPLTQAPKEPDPTTSGTVTVSDFDNIYLNGGEAISFE